MHRARFVAVVRSLTIALAFAIPASGETYFVAPNGHDDQPGTEALPWRTIQHAANRVEPGDTIRIRAGEYFAQGGLYFRRAGTSEAPIVYQAHGDGPVRITNSTIVRGPWRQVREGTYAADVPKDTACAFDGDEPLTPPGPHGFQGNTVEQMIPGSFLVVDGTLNVRLTDGADPSSRTIRIASNHAINLYDCHYSVFDGLTVQYTYNAFKQQGRDTHHVTIRNCTIRSIYSQGIQPVARDCIIEHNLFQKIGTTKFLHGVYCATSNTIIRHNVFEEIAGAAIHLYPDGGQSEVYGNIFRKPRKMANGGYYGEIVAWGDGGHKIYNNLFLGGGVRYGIDANSGGNEIYHNTFVDCPLAVYVHKDEQGNRVQNNLLAGGRIEDLGRESVISHNLQVNPKTLTHEYHLQSGSPALDAGTSLPLVRSDFSGTPRPQGNAPDVGAFEMPLKQR